MSSYMPQDVFDMCVVTAIKFHLLTEDTLTNCCSELYKGYRDSFLNDVEAEKDMKKSAKSVLKLIKTQVEDGQIVEVMTQLQFCIKKFNIDGSKKRRKLFGGTWFTRSKTQIPDRSKACMRNVVVYHQGTISGVFPIAPRGWSL